MTVASRPDFSGKWVFNPRRSTLRVAALAALTDAVVHIEHRDPAFHLSRRFVLNGQEHEVQIALTADDEERESLAGEQHRYSRLTWFGDTLLFTTRIEGPEGVSHNSVRYALTESGHVLTAQEKFRSASLSYDNLWVFDAGIAHDT